VVDVFFDREKVNPATLSMPQESTSPEEFFEYEGPDAGLFVVGRLMSFDNAEGTAKFYGRITKVEIKNDLNATVSFVRTEP